MYECRICHKQLRTPHGLRGHLYFGHGVTMKKMSSGDGEANTAATTATAATVADGLQTASQQQPAALSVALPITLEERLAQLEAQLKNKTDERKEDKMAETCLGCVMKANENANLVTKHERDLEKKEAGFQDNLKALKDELDKLKADPPIARLLKHRVTCADPDGDCIFEDDPRRVYNKGYMEGKLEGKEMQTYDDAIAWSNKHGYMPPVREIVIKRRGER